MNFFAKQKYFISQIINIGKLQGINKKGDLVQYYNCSIHFDQNGFIEEINQPSQQLPNLKTFDAKHNFVTPSFVDPHTHLFTKDRSVEFSQRPIKSYEQIAKEGGGIVSSMKMCRSQTEDEIFEYNKLSMQRFFAQGTLTVEVKSGYGLDTENELKQLRIIGRLQEEFKNKLTIVATFMGAHAYPPEFKGGKEKQYIDLIINEMLPQVAKQGIAEYCDIFCENGYFNVEDSEKVLLAAQNYGLKLRLHADEFQDSKAAHLAGKLKAHSADHLMAISDSGIESLAKNNVVATMLPGTTIFLGKTGFAPARKLINAGCQLAIATDFNPGSSAFQSQPLMMNFAMNYGKLSIKEAFEGVTKNAGLALNRSNIGIIDIGGVGDLIIWDQISDINQIPYYQAESRHMIQTLVKTGQFYYNLH